jgi:hypothetical protein
MGDLRDSQLRMARYLRDPKHRPPPEGIEERRLKVYRDLIFNNVEGFIRGGFPVLRSLYNDEDWYDLVRHFMDGHRCSSPYFLEISQEFIRYLLEEHTARECDPPFIAELAHYEWVELALDVATEELPPVQRSVTANRLVLSPLAWVLSYQYPVHRIGPGFQPEAPDEGCYLVVYRDRSDVVQFMEINAATARLLALFREEKSSEVDAVIARLAGEMRADPATIRPFAMEQVETFLQASILLPA